MSDSEPNAPIVLIIKVLKFVIMELGLCIQLHDASAPLTARGKGYSAKLIFELAKYHAMFQGSGERSGSHISWSSCF